MNVFSPGQGVCREEGGAVVSGAGAILDYRDVCEVELSSLLRALPILSGLKCSPQPFLWFLTMALRYRTGRLTYASR